jgi:hypothetical protein
MVFKLLLKKYYPFLIIISLSAILFCPIWLGIIDFYSGDGSDLIPYIYGSKLLLYQTFQEVREIPLWNPYIMFGQPIVGNLQFALFYPLNIVFLLLSFFNALWVYQAIHMAIAGLGAYLLARHAGCKKNGSMISGCLYMFNGRILYYINAGWLGYFTSICWLPLFVLTSILVLERKERHFPLAFGIVFAMTLLSGTPQYAFMGFCLLLVKGIWQIFLPQSVNDRLSLLYRLLLSGLISFLLISVQLFPALEQTYLSSRIFFDSSSSIHGFHFDWSMKQWFRILFRPEFLRHDFAWELCAYIGIGGMVLSFLGLIVSKKYFQYVLIWGLIPWLFSMGAALPPFDLLLKNIPGMAMLTSPSRYFIFSILILCVFAGSGFEYLFDIANRKRNTYLFFSIAGFGLFFSGFLILPYAQDPAILNVRYFGAMICFFLLTGLYFWKRIQFVQIILICWLIADPILVASNGILTGYHKKDLKPPLKIIQAIKEHPGPVRIASIQPVNLRAYRLTPLGDWIFIQNKIGRAGGYEPLAMLNTLHFLTQLDGTLPISETMWAFRLFDFARPDLYDLAGITHLITFKPIRNPRLKFKTRDTFTMPNFCGGWWREKPVYLYENVNVLPRAFFVAEGSKGGIIPVGMKYVSPDRRYIYIHTKQPGTIIISESFHPGWIAVEKDKPIPLKPFLNTFISCHLPAGEHEIRLEFAPQSFGLGLHFTQTGLFLILFILVLQKGLSRISKKEQSDHLKQLRIL